MNCITKTQLINGMRRVAGGGVQLGDVFSPRVAAGVANALKVRLNTTLKLTTDTIDASQFGDLLVKTARQSTSLTVQNVKNQQTPKGVFGLGGTEYTMECEIEGTAAELYDLYNSLSTSLEIRGYSRRTIDSARQKFAAVLMQFESEFADGVIGGLRQAHEQGIMDD